MKKIFLKIIKLEKDKVLCRSNDDKYIVSSNIDDPENLTLTILENPKHKDFSTKEFFTLFEETGKDGKNE